MKSSPVRVCVSAQPGRVALRGSLAGIDPRQSLIDRVGSASATYIKGSAVSAHTKKVIMEDNMWQNGYQTKMTYCDVDEINQNLEYSKKYRQIVY